MNEQQEATLTVKRPKKGHWQTSPQGGWEWVEDNWVRKPKPNPNDPRLTAEPEVIQA